MLSMNDMIDVVWVWWRAVIMSTFYHTNYIWLWCSSLGSRMLPWQFDKHCAYHIFNMPSSDRDTHTTARHCQCDEWSTQQKHVITTQHLKRVHSSKRLVLTTARGSDHHSKRFKEKLNVTVFDSDVVIIIGVNRNTGISHLKQISFIGSWDINISFNFHQ